MSPAFRKSSRKSSGSAVDFAYDPFTEEDGFVPGKGRKRPRYSLQRTDWHVMDEPADSPQEREKPMDWEKALEDEIEVEPDKEEPADTEPPKEASPDIVPETSDTVNQISIEDPFQDQPSVFVKPSLDLAGGLFGRPALQQLDTESTTSAPQRPFGNLFHRPTDTPQLRPVPSPGLPIPSPLVSNQSNSQEYFSPFHSVPPAYDVDHDLTSDPNSAIPESPSLVQPTPEPALHGMPHIVEESEALHDEGVLSHPPPPMSSYQVLDSMLADSIVGTGSQMPTVNLDHIDSHAVMDESNVIETENALEIREELHMAVSTAHADDQLLEEAKDDASEDDYEAHMASDLEAQDEEFEEFEGTSPPMPPEMAIHEAESDEGVPEETAGQTEVQHLPDVADDEAGTQSGSDSGNQSAAEGEARCDEDAEAEYYSEDEFYEEEEEMEPRYEDEVDADESENEDNRAPGLPPAQAEIIVLDSDSEDELASEQAPATLHRHVRQRSVSSEVSQSSAEDDREDWSDLERNPEHRLIEGQESEDYESEEEYEHENLDQDDRVDDSDMDDESSVDVSVRDGFGEKRSTRNQSAEEEPDAEEPIQPYAEGDDVAEFEGNDASPIDMEVHEYQPDQANDASSPAEEPSPHDLDEEQGQPTLDGEERTSGGTLSALISLDGTHDWPESSKMAEEDHETPLQESTHNIQEEKEIIERQEEALIADESDEQHNNKRLPFDRSAVEPTEQQLPTPDPTQEVPGYKSGPDSEQLGELGVTDEQTGLNISLQPVSEESIDPEPQDDVEMVDVVLPTTELIDDRQQDGEQDIVVPESTVKAPETPIVVVSKPPVPDRNAHGLRSKLSYFAPLASLSDHYNALVDTISVVYESSPVAKATSGSREYFMMIYLTDPSMAGTTLEVRIFRRYKSAMPSVAEGQAILLRDFKVQSHDHSMILVSVDSSSWAVFDGSGPEAKMTGPPVEYGSEERAFASGLRRWYSEDGAGMVADSQLQASIERDSRSRTPSSVAGSDAGSLDGTPSARGSRRSRRSHRRVTIHELRDGTRYTEVGSPSGQHDIHELRDGTVYVHE